MRRHGCEGKDCVEHTIDSGILAMVIISTQELRAARSCALLAEYYPHENLRHEIQKLTEQLLKLCMDSPWDCLAPISSKKRVLGRVVTMLFENR